MTSSFFQITNKMPWKFILGVFWGSFEAFLNHPHTSKDIFTTLNKEKLPFSGPPTHPYALRNIKMASYESSKHNKGWKQIKI